MSFEVDLRSRLKADSGVDALIGKTGSVKSIDWNERPQGARYPSIVMNVVLSELSQHMQGFNHFQPTRTRFRCTDTDRTKAIALRNAVIACIVPEATQGDTKFLRAQGVTHYPTTQGTGTDTLHHEFVDAEMWHGPAA